jgi:hypothetical protein
LDRALASGARGRACESRRAHSGRSSPASTSVGAGVSVLAPAPLPVTSPLTSPQAAEAIAELLDRVRPSATGTRGSWALIQLGSCSSPVIESWASHAVRAASIFSTCVSAHSLTAQSGPVTLRSWNLSPNPLITSRNNGSKPHSASREEQKEVVALHRCAQERTRGTSRPDPGNRSGAQVPHSLPTHRRPCNDLRRCASLPS